MVSPLRARLAQAAPGAGPVSCPAELRELFGPLSFEHVKYPLCAPNLQQLFLDARGTLVPEEDLAVEEFLGAQCRLNPHEAVPVGLATFLQGMERVPRHVGKQEEAADGAAEPIQTAETRSLEILRQALLLAREKAAPLEQWVRNNGDFVVPEEQLAFLDHFVNQNSCRMVDDEVDLSLRNVHNVEELEKIEAPEDPQRARIRRFLDGIRKAVDRKVEEYFR